MSVTGVEIPEEFVILEDKCTIGRARGNSLILADLSLSRHHCTIDKNKDHWTLTDMSANGLCLNSKTVEKNVPCKIKDGDNITLTDRLTFTFQLYPSDGEDRPKLTRVHGDVQKVTLDDSVIDLCDVAPQKASGNASLLQKSQSTSSPLDPMREELTCAICAEIFIKATVLNCMHTFCYYCITMWRKNSNICPICRANITRDPVTSLVIENCCKQVTIGLPEEEKKKREELIKGREVELASTANKKKTPARRGGRGRGRGRQQGRGSRQATGSSRRQNLIEIEISSSDSDNDDLDELDEVVLWQEFLDFDDVEADYTGMPGRYYGGYGSCYICHQPGHWANGCPNR